MQSWRDKQLTAANLDLSISVLEQEAVCIKYLLDNDCKKLLFIGHPLYSDAYEQIINEMFAVTDIDYDSLYITGKIFEYDTLSSIKKYIKSKLHRNIKNVVVCINRFALIKDDESSVVDDLAETIELNIKTVDNRFKRLYDPLEVSGKYLVFAHAQDIYGFTDNKNN